MASKRAPSPSTDPTLVFRWTMTCDFTKGGWAKRKATIAGVADRREADVRRAARRLHPQRQARREVQDRRRSDERRVGLRHQRRRQGPHLQGHPRQLPGRSHLWDQPRGGQLQLNLRFAKIDLKADKTPLPIVPGIYSLDTKQDQLVYPSAADRTFTSIMLGSISLDGLKAGEVELTKIGDGWVCGEARLATKDSSFTGTFAAKLVDAK